MPVHKDHHSLKIFLVAQGVPLKNLNARVKDLIKRLVFLQYFNCAIKGNSVDFEIEKCFLYLGLVFTIRDP